MLGRVFRGLSHPVKGAGFHTTRVVSSHGISQHRPSAHNNLDTPFEWDAESLEMIETTLKKYPSNYKRSAVIPLLYIAQEQKGAKNWLPLTAMNKIAETLDMAPIRVYEVASFYTMFNREPVGTYHIQLCGTTTCMTNGAYELKSVIEDHLDIKEGGTSADGMFTLQEVECLGACVNAPMVQINNREFYEHLTPEIMIDMLDTWKKGGIVKEGNQNGLHTCEGPMGKTSLHEEHKPVCRDLDALKAELEKPAEEEAKA